MSPIEIRPIPNFRWRIGLIGVAGIIALYFFLGYLPTVLWLCGGVFVAILVHSAVRGESTDPCIVLDEEGVLDKRLKVGVISWDDIRRISLYDLQGAPYVCLELHNAETYAARQPAWLKLASKTQRLVGMSSMSISTSGLDMDNKTLAGLIHEGCERASQRRSEVPL
jgi:hypothetical protein